MFRDKKRYWQDPSVVIRSSFATFQNPRKWKAPSLVFVCSWSDFWIEEADEWREEAFAIMRTTPHIYQIPTKRPERIASHLPHDWGEGYPNVMLGVSVESQTFLNRAEMLAEIPCQGGRLISYEPALGPVDFSSVLFWFDWLISGGESGFGKPGDEFYPRPADMDWFRSARDQCARFEVPYFHKQSGGTKRIDGKAGGNLLDGMTHENYPESFSRILK
jgi:protein gp37